jgi:hypothetical protein
VLERSTYPDITYTFLHQQFQESFAALHLKRELTEIVITGTGDDADFKKLIAGMHASELPPSMHPRALESYVASARGATAPLDKFLAWRQAASFGPESFVNEIKGSLSQLEDDQVRELESHGFQGRELRATIEMLRRSNQQ